MSPGMLELKIIIYTTLLTTFCSKPSENSTTLADNRDAVYIDTETDADLTIQL